ncbi:hypothetical protein L218DRAFT_946113 [Marasmius fiardii PR-910]|nr:hypothetical protein L218DRAFT_946113 [Marasmius fiardii PR-910]
MAALFLITKLALILLSAILFDRCYVPPFGNPEIPAPPSLKSSFYVKREWFLNCIVVYYFPIQRMAYLAISFLEAKFIANQLYSFPGNTFSDHYSSIKPPTSGMSTWLALFGLVVAITGGIIRLSCYHSLGQNFSFNLLVVVSPSDKLVTSGPYSFIRHPSYTGIIALSGGLILYNLSPGSWIRESGILEDPFCSRLVWFWVGVVNFVNVTLTLRASEEDEQLKRKFGEEWEAWRQSVKHRLVPGLYYVGVAPFDFEDVSALVSGLAPTMVIARVAYGKSVDSVQ